ncbi:unnamed protein product, partial [Cuscuta campestris]
MASRMFNAGVTEGQSTTRPPLFDGTNYSYWKERMRIFIQSNDYKLWLIVKNGCGVLMKKVGEVIVPKTEEEFTDEDCKKMVLNAKAINMIYCSVNADDYRKISRCETAKQMWEKLEVTYEGTAQVREAKIDHLTHEYELFSMKENEKIEEMFERFSNIINCLNLLGETYTDRELVRKELKDQMASRMFNAGVNEGQSTTRPPLFDGTNYSYWKERMRIFIQSNDYKLWLIVKNGCRVPMKKVGEVNVPKTEEEFTDEDCKKMELNAKAINMIYCGVNADDYRKILRCETAKQMWEKLEVTYEGTAQVWDAKIDHLTHEYELFSMKENEKIEEMFERFSNIMNPHNLLGKTYTDRELMRKVLRSLSSKWRSKVDAIEESRDFLRGNLITYETTQLSKVVEERNKRSIALPATTSTHNNVDDEDDDSDDTDLRLFVRKFKKMMLKKGAKKNTPPKCYGCGEIGHIKPMCPELKNEKDKREPKKQRAYISWENDGSGSEDSETEEVANLCLMAIEDSDTSKEVSDLEPSPNDPLTLNDVVCIVEDLVSVALPTTEAEYVAAGSCCAQILWLKQQLVDFGLILDHIPIRGKMPRCKNASSRQESAVEEGERPWRREGSKYIHIQTGLAFNTGASAERFHNTFLMKEIVSPKIVNKDLFKSATYAPSKSLFSQQDLTRDTQVLVKKTCFITEAKFFRIVYREEGDAAPNLDLIVADEEERQNETQAESSRAGGSRATERVTLLRSNLYEATIAKALRVKIVDTGRAHLKNFPFGKDVGLGEGQSTTRPPLFDGTNYTYWKERMRIYIQSTNFLLWRIIKNAEDVPMKKVGETNVPKTENEYDAQDIKKVENNAKAINIIYCSVNPDDYRKISCCTTAKEMWDKLEITYEGTDKVREAKIDFLTHEYELFRMKENEKIDEMFERFSKIVNDLHALKKTYTDKEL